MRNATIRRYFRPGTLVQLRAFEAVARHCNLTRAGEELHMAQSTVSTHIRKLTDAVGVPLLEHVGKRVRLTAAGDKVQAACRGLCDVFSGLDDALASILELRAGKLRIATTSAGEYLLPGLLAQFALRHPGIEIALHAGARQEIIERFARDADDLYLLTHPPETDAIVAHPIMPNPLVALAPADHPLAGEKDIAFERFAREPLLVRETGSGTRLAVERLFAAHRLKPSVRMELGSSESIKEAIRAGLGVSLMHRHAFGFDIDATRVVLLDVRGLPHDASLHLVHPGDRQLSLIARTFVAFARNEGPRMCEARLVCKPDPGQPRNRRT